MQKKLANKFYLSVEGNTEKWYFDWLAKKINTEPAALNRVTLKCSVEKNPVSYVKSLVPPYGSSISISHICDYEGGNRQQQAQFSSVLTNLKVANTIKPGIKYKLLGYSNLTFELWLILHKQECNGHLSECQQYLPLLNTAYATDFESLRKYKEETNFKKILAMLSLADVKNAIMRSQKIMTANKATGLREQVGGGFRYYKENPSLMIWQVAQDMLQQSGL